MFFIPGWLIALVTFPGVIVHEFAHRLFCDLAGVPVYQVCYFRIGTPSGYVVHGRTTDLRANLLISIGPLLVNTLLCALLGAGAVIAAILREDKIPLLFVLFLWLGFSIGMHSFPSNTDMANFMAALKESNTKGPLYWLAEGFYRLVYLANLLRMVWFDLFYAGAVSCLIPWITIGLSPLDLYRTSYS